MSLPNVKVILDKKKPSNRSHVFVLNLEANVFMDVKISSPQEVVDRSSNRNYKSNLKNAYMIFMIDCCEAFDAAKKNKKNKKFRQNSEPFRDVSLLWRNAPKEVKDEYEEIFVNYKKLIPKGFSFVSCLPQEGANENVDEIVILGQHSAPEEIQHLPIDLNSLGNECVEGAYSKKKMLK